MCGLFLFLIELVVILIPARDTSGGSLGRDVGSGKRVAQVVERTGDTFLCKIMSPTPHFTVFSLVLAALCAANFGWWEPQITKSDEELNVGPGL